MEIATRVLAQKKLPHYANFFHGDPYVGAREAEMKKKNDRITELEKEVKALRSQVAQLEKRFDFKALSP